MITGDSNTNRGGVLVSSKGMQRAEGEAKVKVSSKKGDGGSLLLISNVNAVDTEKEACRIHPEGGRHVS